MSIHSLTQMSVPDGALRAGNIDSIIARARAGNIATGVDTAVENPTARTISRTRRDVLELLAVRKEDVQACINEFMELV